jgi:hypothetical protein
MPRQHSSENMRLSTSIGWAGVDPLHPARRLWVYGQWICPDEAFVAHLFGRAPNRAQYATNSPSSPLSLI